MVGEKKIFLSLEYAHTLNVFLAAHAVLLAEFGGKARIAHVAFFGYVRNSYILVKAAVDIFGDVFYAVDIRCACGASVYIKPCGYPQSYYAENQSVYL